MKTKVMMLLLALAACDKDDENNGGLVTDDNALFGTWVADYTESGEMKLHEELTFNPDGTFHAEGTLEWLNEESVETEGFRRAAFVQNGTFCLMGDAVVTVSTDYRTQADGGAWKTDTNTELDVFTCDIFGNIMTTTRDSGTASYRRKTHIGSGSMKALLATADGHPEMQGTWTYHHNDGSMEMDETLTLRADGTFTWNTSMEALTPEMVEYLGVESVDRETAGSYAYAGGLMLTNTTSQRTQYNGSGWISNAVETPIDAWHFALNNGRLTMQDSQGTSVFTKQE